MKYETYKIEASEDFKRFEFVSEGPKGRITKEVRYDDISEIEHMFGFGDVIGGIVNTDMITDNKDTEKVLMTVGSTLYEFFRVYPHAIVYIHGRPPSRTRLYQMAIAGKLEALTKDFDVLGQIGWPWYPFKKNLNYDGFRITKKEI